MPREQNLAAQEHLGELVNSGDLDRLDEVFAADVVDHDPAPDQGPGPEGFRQFFTALTTAFPDAQIEADALVADDEHVAIACRVSGTHRGDFVGVPATGSGPWRPVECRWHGSGTARSSNGAAAPTSAASCTQLGAQVRPRA